MGKVRVVVADIERGEQLRSNAYAANRELKSVLDPPERSAEHTSGGATPSALLGGPPDQVLRISWDGMCRALNPVEREPGLTGAGRLTGKRLHEALAPEAVDEAMSLVRQTLESGEVHALRFRLPVNGGFGEYEAILVPSGREEVLAVVSDLSRRKRLDTQILRSQQLEAVGYLAGGVAHDFNNLLTAVMGHCQLGMRGLDPESTLMTYLREIQKAAEHGAHLCRQLLIFSRRQTVEPKHVDLNDLVRSVTTMVRRLIGEDIDLVTRTVPVLGLVKAGEGQIEQVIVNLIVNACDAMPSGGILTIETDRVAAEKSATCPSIGVPPGDYAVVTVRDTGTGIPADLEPQIFEPFTTTKEPGKGAGLGLFIAHGIISHLNGHIAVSSKAGEGTTFKVYIPRVDGPYTPEEPPVDSQQPRRGREKVLLVEDEQVVRDVVSSALRAEGYTVLEASDGVQALRLAQGHGCEDLDLLFTDVVMPVMSGWELADKVREHRPGIRVLYTTGYTGDSVGFASMHQNGTGFIEKPFTPAELTRKVRVLLES